MSILKTSQIQDVDGNYILRDGLLATSGSIIEEFRVPCDGRTVSTYNGDITVENVTAYQDLGNSYADATGSTIAYQPPSWAKYVVYTFDYQMAWNQDHSISHWMLFYGSNEITFARHTESGRYIERRQQFIWTFEIRPDTTDYTVGVVSSWDAPVTIKMQARQYGSSNGTDIHRTYYWDGAASSLFSMPQIGIKAIA